MFGNSSMKAVTGLSDAASPEISRSAIKCRIHTAWPDSRFKVSRASLKVVRSSSSSISHVPTNDESSWLSSSSLSYGFETDLLCRRSSREIAVIRRFPNNFR